MGIALGKIHIPQMVIYTRHNTFKTASNILVCVCRLCRLYLPVVNFFTCGLVHLIIKNNKISVLFFFILLCAIVQIRHCKFDLKGNTAGLSCPGYRENWNAPVIMNSAVSVDCRSEC